MIEFLGRKHELAVLDQAVATSGPTNLVVIFGEGGIGKTRLLKELEERHSQNPACIVLRAIDFDNPNYDLLQEIASILTKRFIDEFKEYQTLQAHQRAVFDTVPMASQRQEIETAFIDSVERVTQQYRLVLLFDTVEKIFNQRAFGYLLTIFAQLHNVTIVLASRPDQNGVDIQHPLAQQLMEIFGGSTKIDFIRLLAFDDATAMEYVDRKQLQVDVRLQHKYKQALILLAEGKPILIDMAIELGNWTRFASWLQRVAEQVDELQILARSADPADRRRLDAERAIFNEKLVEWAKQTLSRLDQLVIVLAYVSPLSASSVGYILGFSTSTVSQLFDQARQRVIFKFINNESITLHDVVHDLLKQYVLPSIDPTGQQRDFYLAQAIATLEQQAQHIEAEIEVLLQTHTEHNDLLESINQHHFLRLHMIEYRFRLNVLNAAAVLDQDIQAIRRYSSLPSMLIALCELVEPYLEIIRGQSSEAYFRVKTLLADQYVSLEQFDRARAFYAELEPYIRESPPRQHAEITRRRGMIEMGSGNVRQALKYFREAADIARQHGEIDLQIAANISCGWATRSYGSLDQPESYYDEALSLAIQLENRATHTSQQPELLLTARKYRASVLNGLSYVYAIRKRAIALELIEQAISIRMSLGVHERAELAQSYTTAGEVYCELGQPATALEHLDRAEQLFKTLGLESDNALAHGRVVQSRQWLGKVFSARGRAYESLWELSSDIAMRKEYLSQAERTLKLAVEFAIAVDRPRALQRLGFAYAATPERRPQALKTWLECFHAAQQFGDAFMEFNVVGNLAHLATLGYRSDLFTNTVAFEHWYQDYMQRLSPDAQFNVLLARFQVYQGALALLDGQVDQAYHYLDQGLSTLATRHYDVSYSFTWQICYLEQDIFPQLGSEVVQVMASNLLKRSTNRNLSEVWLQRLQAWNEGQV